MEAAGPVWRAMRNEHLSIAMQAVVLAVIAYQSLALQFRMLESAPDFVALYTAGRLALEGQAAEAYRHVGLAAHISRTTGWSAGMPWAYPPPAFLFMIPFALLPVGLSFFAFTAGGMLVYCRLLRRLSGEFTPGALAFSLPAMVTCGLSGQNGFWSASALCLIAICFRRGANAGFAAGLLILKPHLLFGAVALALFLRKWRDLAAAGVMAACLLAVSTIALGTSIWGGFADAMAHSAQLLEDGRFPLSRMTSGYAMFRRLVPAAGATGAMALHLAALAIMAMATLYLWTRRPDPAISLAGAIWLGLLASPYMYDYDLVAIGVATGLALPFVSRILPGTHLLAMLALSWLASANITLNIVRVLTWSAIEPGSKVGPGIPVSFLALALMGAWAGIALGRTRRRGPLSATATGARLPD